MNDRDFCFEVAGISVKICGKMSRIPASLLRSYYEFLTAENIETDITIEIVSEAANDSYTLSARYESDDGELIFGEQGENRVIILNSNDGVLVGEMLMNADFSSVRLFIDGTPSERKYAFSTAVMMAYSFYGLERGVLLIHAAAVVSHDMAFLLLGKSGTGKSTHAALWLKNMPDAQLLNDDNPVVYFDSIGRPFVSGSPWSGKTPCYHNRSLPLGGIVQLAQASRNSIRPMGKIEAFGNIINSLSALKFEREYMLRLEHVIERLFKYGVRFRHMSALPDDEAALLCHSNLTSTQSDVS